MGDLQGLRVDHADGSAELVGDPVLASVRGEGASPWPVAHQNVRQDDSFPRIDDGNRVGGFCSDKHAFSVRSEPNPFRFDSDVFDDGSDGTAGDVDDRRFGIVLVGNDEDFAAGVDIEQFGVVAGIDVAGDGLRLEIEHLDAVGLTRGD